MADIDYSALGQALDTTWGRSSTPKTASQSVKISLLGTDRILVSYAVIVNFATERSMIESKRAYASESEAIIDAAVKQVKTSYKDLAGETLKAKLISSVDSLEIISMNVHSAKRTAYYRRKSVFEIG